MQGIVGYFLNISYFPEFKIMLAKQGNYVVLCVFIHTFQMFWT